MTRAEIVGAALVKLAGGRPQADLGVTWSDLDTYIVPAANFVMLNKYPAIMQDANSQRLLMQVYPAVAVALDATRKKFMATLTKTPMTVPGQTGVIGVEEQSGRAYEQFVPDMNTLGTFALKIEEKTTSFTVEKDKLVFYNLPAAISTVVVKQLVRLDDIGQDEQFLVPAGAEVDIIDAIIQFFIAQRDGRLSDIGERKDHDSN